MDQELLGFLYYQMLRIRRFEEEAARLYTERKIGGFLHLYIGQEAIAVGAASVMEKEDSVITGYRCHGHYLARGGDLAAGFGELLGKANGCAKGRGGSMHFYDVKNRMMGGWGIVGGQIPVGAGFAFASKYRGESAVTICYLGDGAINIGAFHEGLALASLWKLPVIFVIENNHFAMGTPLHKTSPVRDLSIRALGYPMARDTIDGHDIFSVREGIFQALRRAREQSLPTLIEARTYRYRGHSMADPAKYRTKEELDEWRDRDPILLLGKRLEELGLADIKKKLDEKCETEIKAALQEAESAPYPDPQTAEEYVYG